MCVCVCVCVGVYVCVFVCECVCVCVCVFDSGEYVLGIDVEWIGGWVAGVKG